MPQRAPFRWEAGRVRPRLPSMPSPSAPPRTRLAPTPSGFLHLGNAVNALLINWWAADVGASVSLRIDDVDAPRSRPEYMEDVFDLYRWLGIAWEGAPESPHGRESLRSRRVERARAVLAEAEKRGLQTYACNCSRRDLPGIPTGGCSGGCRSRHDAFEPESTALRVTVPIGTVIEVDSRSVRLDEAMGDFVIWRRDGIPSYQWLSVVEDTDARMTHILRGEDLVDSSAAQIFLARHLPDTSFSKAIVRHHPLVRNALGRKLAKSQIGGRPSLERSPETRAHVWEVAAAIAEGMGIHPRS